MNRRKPITPRQLAREKLLFRYSSALERGDFDTLAIILREAEADPTLEKMLAEMDAVYRAELAPLPVLPTLSSNHNHRHTREDETMNVPYPTISRRLPDTHSRGRWNSAATLAAAMIALVLFAAILIARRPPTDPQQGNPGVAMQNETATPIPSLTIPPLVFHPIVSMTPTAVQFSNTAIDPSGLQLIPTIIPPSLCQGVVYQLDGVNLLSAPGVDGIVIGQIPAGAAADVTILQTTQHNTTGVLWLFVRTQINSDTVQGWVQGNVVTITNSCFDVSVQPISAPCPIASGTVNSTPIPDPAVEPIDGVSATATFVIARATERAAILQNSPTLVALLTQNAPEGDSIFATATAMAQTAMPQPTTVPPCIIQTPPTLPPEIGVPSVPLDRFIFYTVQFGDTLLSLITTYSITLEEIAFLNPQLVFNTCDFTLQDGGTNCNALPAPGGTIKLPIPNIPINATPIAVFDLALRDGGYVLLTTEQVGDIPANALVRINSAQYNGSEWLYEVIAKDGETRGQAHDWQLQYAPDFVPGAATPTAIFDGALGSGFYAAVTNQAVGNIPAGTRVQIGSAFYNGVEWNYNISDDSGRQNTARESQLDFAPDYTPGMATPTAAYFDLRGQILITLEQVGSIPPNTPVQATSGYYDGTEWVYGIMTLDSSAFADARASQLQAVSLDEVAVPPIPISATPPPTFTLTPVS